MTFATLQIIHRLLVEEERRTFEVKEAARKAWHDAEDLTGEEAPEQVDAFRAAGDEHWKVKSALNEFLDQDWR